LVTVWLLELFPSEINHSPPSSAQVKNAWSYTSATHMSLWYRLEQLFFLETLICWGCALDV